MDKKNIKMDFEKKDKSKEKQNRKKINTLRQAFCGNNIDKKPLKLQENSLFRPFYKTQEQKHRQQKTKPPKSKKTYQKKTFLHFGKQPLFLVIFCFLSRYILSCLQSCVLLKTL